MSIEVDELVTVVIPARNEEGFVLQCLESVQDQDYAALQIIVVDGDSEDRTPDIVRAAAALDDRIELMVNPQRIIPTSLNQALAAARGRWLVRVDAHATVPRDYVGRAVEHLRTGRWGGVGGVKAGVGVTAQGVGIAGAMGSRFGVGNSTYHYGTSVQTVDHIPFGAYPVALVRELGGWDESLRVNQDFEFDHRLRVAGHDLLFDPSLTIRWHSRQSIVQLYRQYLRYGSGKVAVARKHPASISPRHLAAPALVAELAIAAAAGVRRPIVGLALLAPYLVALVGASAATARRIDDRAARRYVGPAFVAMHVGWGLGFWLGLIDWALRAASGRATTHA